MSKNGSLTHIAKRLRRDMTDAERVLWHELRARRFEGFKFKRQEPLGSYVVDFVCHTARLVVEVDGGQHADREAADQERTRWLESQGFRVLRFWNNEVLANIDGVMQVMEKELALTFPLSPALSHEGRGSPED